MKCNLEEISYSPYEIDNAVFLYWKIIFRSQTFTFCLALFLSPQVPEEIIYGLAAKCASVFTSYVVNFDCLQKTVTSVNMLDNSAETEQGSAKTML